MACIVSKQPLYELDVENMPTKKLVHGKNLSVYLPEEISKQDFDDGYEVDEEMQEDMEEKGFDEEVDMYSSDEFRMYEFKVRRCMRGRSHDWTDCPFAHPGEKARRRDPRRYHYSGAVCPDFRRSETCPHGEACELAHGVFECWLHPARYRTMLCKEGRRCRRKVCFFAHTPQQLRVLSSHNSSTSPPPPPQSLSSATRWATADKTAATLSPTSTLIKLSSPPESPPISPSVAELKLSWFKKKSALESYSKKKPEMFFTYDALYEELLTTLDAMELSLSSRTTTTSSSSHSSIHQAEPRESAIRQNSFGSGCDGGGPDLEWINELLM